jgi:hypothetical protein
MNNELVRKHIQLYKKRVEKADEQLLADLKDREARKLYNQSWTIEKILEMSEADLAEYLGKLWAMLIWGNKQYVIDKLIQDHGLKTVCQELANLVWSQKPIEQRWDTFRKNIKGVGPAMMSEILCHVHPALWIIWNRRAFVGLNYLGFENLPRYNYQATGKKYAELSEAAKTIVLELKNAGIID